MGKIDLRQLDAQGVLYATVDERGFIIGTGTREVCEFLVAIANKNLRPITKAGSPPPTNGATIRSAIEI